MAVSSNFVWNHLFQVKKSPILILTDFMRLGISRKIPLSPQIVRTQVVTFAELIVITAISIWVFA